MNRIFTFVAVVAVGLAIMGMGFGPVAGQPTNETTTATATPTETTAPTTTATNETANETTTWTTTATATPTETTAPTSSPTATPAPTPTATPRPTAVDVVEDVEPTNATADDVRKIVGWLRSESEDRSQEQIERAREWLQEAADERDITFPGLGIDGSNETTPTETGESPRSQSTPEPERNSSQLPGEPLDEQTSLANWRFSDGMFTLTFEYIGERPRTVTLTESTQGEEGTQRFATTEERLLPGRNTITMNTMIQGGESAVSISTEQSREAGYGIAVSTGEQGSNPFGPFGGTSGVLSGVGISMLLSGGAAGWVIWREESGVIKA